MFPVWLRNLRKYFPHIQKGRPSKRRLFGQCRFEADEAKHFPMDLPDPVEAIKFEMKRKDLTAKDLEPIIGKSNRVYKILNHKRLLTMKMIWKLHEDRGIPA